MSTALLSNGTTARRATLTVTAGEPVTIWLTAGASFSGAPIAPIALVSDTGAETVVGELSVGTPAQVLAGAGDYAVSLPATAAAFGVNRS